jgi:hypothetical protein
MYDIVKKYFHSSSVDARRLRLDYIIDSTIIFHNIWEHLIFQVEELFASSP